MMDVEKNTNKYISIKIVLSVLFSSFAFLGFFFLSRIDYEDIIRLPFFIYIIPFILLGLLYYKRLSSNLLQDKRKLVISIILSFLFALSLIAGYQLRVSIALAEGLKGKIGIIVKSIALSFLFIPFFEIILYYSVNPLIKKSSKDLNEASKDWNRIIVFFVSWIIILLCWLPILLAYWPGIMSYDSHRQFNEAYNNIFWELQPIAHTFLIRLALIIGQKIGSLEVGISIYSLLQMTTLSIALGYVTSFIYKLCKKKLVVIVSLLFYAILPITSVLSISVTKDIFFTAFFLILCTALIERFCTQEKYPIVFEIIIVVSGALMMLFRKNGIYGFVLYTIVFAISLLIILAKKKKNDKKGSKKYIVSIIICVITILAGLLTMNVVKLSLHAGNGPAIEKYSVMIQQFARVAYYHKDTLSTEDAKIIDTYLPGYSSDPQYHFSLADAPKYNANGDAFSDTSKFLKDWIHIVVTYPEDCLDAYLGLVSGYFFTDDLAISRYLGYGRDNMRGLLETFNAVKPGVEGDVHIESVSKLPRLQYFIEGIVSNEEYLYYPIVPILFRPAFYIWVAITCIAILIYKKRYQLFLVSSLQIAYFLTVLLGPVANIRYAFQIILFVPLFITIAYFINPDLIREG
ncbi:MAG: DUF6020 family protein [Lachnospiraceae bacterium]|nr:DUF6020 family protein [Lachnospiraceae bacterium]